MEIRKVKFYDEFECMGGNCPLTCCGGWTVLIDSRTYKRYRKMGSHIAKFAKKNLVPYSGTDDYYIKKNSLGLCPMCDKEQLCAIVREKGPDVLSYVCQRFPRETFDVVSAEENYLSCSCVRVVEMIYSLKDKITYVADDIDTADALHVLPKKSCVDLQIRTVIVAFIQNDEMPLWFREFYGAYVLTKIKDDYNKGAYNEVMDSLKDLYRKEYWKTFYSGLKEIKVDREVQFESVRSLLSDIAEWVYDVSFQDKFNYMMRVEELIEINQNCMFSEWEMARQKWNKERNLLAEENLFAYDCMRCFLPYMSLYGEFLLDSYLISLLISILTHHVQILFCIRYGFDRKMNEIIVSVFDRVFRNDNPYLRKIIEKRKESGMLSVAFLRCLLDI